MPRQSQKLLLKLMPRLREQPPSTASTDMVAFTIMDTSRMVMATEATEAMVFPTDTTTTTTIPTMAATPDIITMERGPLMLRPLLRLKLILKRTPTTSTTTMATIMATLSATTLPAMATATATPTTVATLATTTTERGRLMPMLRLRLIPTLLCTTMDSLPATAPTAT